jgi:hypothetical protein
MLTPISTELSDLGKLKEEAEAGAAAMVARMNESFDSLEKALRKWDEESRKVDAR